MPPLISERALSKSLVMLTFLSMGIMCIYAILEIGSVGSLNPIASAFGVSPQDHDGDLRREDIKATKETFLPPCNKTGERLVGRLAVDKTVPNMEDIVKSWNMTNWVLKGGASRPKTCQSLSKVAIIIPYRNRYQQLKIFLRHLHPILKRQLLDYRIIVVEQNGDTPFNRAMLFNIGYKEALKLHDFQCFVFHDVDLIPEDDRNSYGCPSRPRHLSVAVDTLHYRLPYATIFGGVSSLTKEQFEKINGFSNKFWGWGGEDDDLYKRITAVGYSLSRPNIVIGRYTMLQIGHKSAKKDDRRHEKLETSEDRMSRDGLNTLKYDVIKTEEHQLHTQFTVNVDPAVV
ncbi:beta-1,4-galactosyltransferase 1-like isoform X2 [Dendronephthya gigantea]|uniref:beta-1,4-galactosyltransferase 1-like isoform X2 n=1 Tax=Dendronephthya gigantea TaxID=151771 RepID=UPI00106978D2|nr:beta-1,4-galactosyltransferase 1-like isoform X2 [Dendronephthya gigantea]